MAKTRQSSKTPTLNPDEKPDLVHDLLVVGIGASAGGIQALQEFFSNVPADSGAAYVVILHLSPDHDSQLAHVLSNVTPLPIEQIKTKTKVEANHVYVVPPDRSLSMFDGSIIVKNLETIEERRAPVDIFFRTLAESHGTNAVGVILSGTGANGSNGIKRIKEFGGATFAQNPREAEFNEMPRNSIATEYVDVILPVAEMPAKILEYRNNRATISIADEPEQRRETHQNALRDIFTLLRVRTGHDFANYKRPTMLRRIERRIGVKSLPDIETYATYLKDNPDEARGLLKDLLISVTNFFRDKKCFEAIENTIIPKLLDRPADRPIRIWIAGCATGEEAYSLAMLFAEHTMGDLSAPQVQIFATDIDEQAIATAREGLYTLNDAADVSPERLKRFFTKEGDRYRIRREIREMVLFAQHNLIKDPPFSHLSLVSCRNLLIYFNQVAQERVFEIIHFALEPGGYLFTGTSESVDGSADLFAPVDKANHIFQSRQVTVRPLPVPESVPIYRAVVSANGDKSRPPAALTRISFNDLHLKLLDQIASPSIVVDQNYEIVHISERAAKYLQVAGGEPTNNLLQTLPPDIRAEIRGALFQATQQQTNVEISGLQVLLGDKVETINVLIRPVTSETDTARGYILVVFEPAVNEDSSPDHETYARPEPVSQALEDELIISRSQLHSALEQAEVQSEELRASNEELQAMNEELRSAAEELETSKEELQSINEEMRTVNQELNVKIDELSHTNNNFTNLLSSIDIGVIFLDRSLRVALFSPASTRIFNLIKSDIGRPLTDITSKITYDDLASDADHVIETLTSIEREVRTVDERIFIMRMFPYRTSEDRINGVVATFVEISERKHIEEALQISELRYRTLFASIDEGFCTIDVIFDENDKPVDYLFIETNPAFERHVGLENVVGKTMRELVPDFEGFWFETYGEVARTGQPLRFEYEAESLDRYFDVYAFRMGRPGHNRVAVIFTNITDRRRREANLAFLADISQDLVRLTGIDDTIVTLAEKIGKYFGVWRCSFAEVDDAAGEVTIGHAWVKNGHVDTAAGEVCRLSDCIEYEVIEASRAGEIMVVGDTVSDPRTNPAAYSERNTRAFLSVPFVSNGKWLGTLSISDSNPRDWRTDEIDLFRELAGRIWIRLDRATSDDALRESEESRRMIVESISDFAIFTTDRKRRVTSWNIGAQKVFGWTEAEIIGKSADRIFTPEDREAKAAENEAATAIAKGRAPDERFHIRKDGSRFYASGVTTPLMNGSRIQGFVKIARDMTGQIAADKAISDSEMLRKLVAAQEQERARLARDLHDELGQQLTVLRLRLDSLRAAAKAEPLQAELDDLDKIARNIDEGIDHITWELRPLALEDLGLVPALENYVKDWCRYSDVHCEFVKSSLRNTRFKGDVESNIYRIVQEALNNIAKHANATSVEIMFERQDDDIVLVIEDNGKGFNPKNKKLVSKGLGLSGMRERAALIGGSVEIESTPKKGTTIFVKLHAAWAMIKK